MITYQPSPHFKQNLRDLAPYLTIAWVEETEALEIWSRLPDKKPVMEHNFYRGNKGCQPTEDPLLNWNMEWIVLAQLYRARRWQHESATEFQNNMTKNNEKIKEAGENAADAKYENFLNDPYWRKKREQELNNDFGACTSQWSGSATPEGK